MCIYLNLMILIKIIRGFISARRESEAGWSRLEREFLEFRADLPLHYVRREDYLRGQAVLEAKLDALYSKIELIQRGNH